MNIETEENQLLATLESMLLQNKYSTSDSFHIIQILQENQSKRVIELCCLILDKVYFDMNLDLLTMALDAPHPVPLTALKALLKNPSTLLPTVAQNESLVQRIVLLLKTECHEQSRSVLKQVVQLDNSRYFVEMLVPPFQDLLSLDNDIITLRVYETITDLSLYCFDLFQEYGLLQFLELDFDQVLVTLSTLQLFQDLVKDVNGYDLLLKTKVLEKLSQVSITTDKFIIFKVIQFWGYLMFYQSNKCEEIQHKFTILDLFYRLYQSDDTQTQEQVLVALGNVGSTPEGLVLLNTHQVLNTILQDIPRVVGSMKSTMLCTVSCLLSHQSPNCDGIVKKVYTSIAREPFQELVKLSKSQIEEVCIAAFVCLSKVVGFQWGLRDFATSDTISYFMNRDGSTKVLEWKYAIVQSVLRDSRSRSCFSNRVLEVMEEFNRQGPFKKEYVPQVAFASG